MGSLGCLYTQSSYIHSKGLLSDFYEFNLGADMGNYCSFTGAGNKKVNCHDFPLFTFIETFYVLNCVIWSLYFQYQFSLCCFFYPFHISQMKEWMNIYFKTCKKNLTISFISGSLPSSHLGRASLWNRCEGRHLCCDRGPNDRGQPLGQQVQAVPQV